MEAASDSPASVHGSSSEENTGAAPATSSAVASLAATYWVDSTKPALCRKFPGHAVQVATMHPGDHGCAVAKFSACEDHPAEQKQTEIPNLLLQEHFVGKKPAMRKKRPAAVGSGSGEEKKRDHPEPAAAVAPVDMGYSIMTYASTGAVAIRETKLGKRQLFQIRYKKKYNAQLKTILEKAKQKLLKGEPVEQVKFWAKEAAQ